MNATTNGTNTNHIASAMTTLGRLRENPKLILLVVAAAAISVVLALLLWAKSPIIGCFLAILAIKTVAQSCLNCRK